MILYLAARHVPGYSRIPISTGSWQPGTRSKPGPGGPGGFIQCTCSGARISRRKYFLNDVYTTSGRLAGQNQLAWLIRILSTRPKKKECILYYKRNPGVPRDPPEWVPETVTRFFNPGSCCSRNRQLLVSTRPLF